MGCYTMKIELLQFGPTGNFVFRSRLGGSTSIMGLTTDCRKYQVCFSLSGPLMRYYQTESWYIRNNKSPFYIEVNNGTD